MASVILPLIGLLGLPFVGHVEGRVTGPDDDPLSGVKVCLPLECVLSDSDGTFRLERSDDPYSRYPFVFVSKAGYQAVFLPADEVALDLQISLPKKASNPRRIDSCPKNGRWIGFSLRVPDDERPVKRTGRDSDYETIALGFPTELPSWLRMGSGPNWSLGFPLSRDLEQLEEMSARELDIYASPELDSTYIDGVEVKGRFPDGRLYRYVGVVSESLSYEASSQEAADYFDSLLDRLCRFRRTE
ncbi:MAG TPA: carboxypeptidase-like regulatory domain-containing protein [Acidobacteriota bacterium]|nr:carboxypeptidase-like regulatory domain-containing protein [Acidobacteriota bacterium]